MTYEQFNPVAMIDGPSASISIYKRRYAPEKFNKEIVEQIIQLLCQLTNDDAEDYTMSLLNKKEI